MAILQAFVLALVAANFYAFGLLYLVAQVGAILGQSIWHLSGAYVLTSLALVLYYLTLAHETIPDYFEE